MTYLQFLAGKNRGAQQDQKNFNRNIITLNVIKYFYAFCVNYERRNWRDTRGKCLYFNLEHGYYFTLTNRCLAYSKNVLFVDIPFLGTRSRMFINTRYITKITKKKNSNNRVRCNVVNNIYTVMSFMIENDRSFKFKINAVYSSINMY